MEEQEYLYLKDKDVYSAQNVLASFEIKLADTVYADSTNDFLRWPFSAVQFFMLEKEGSCENVSPESLLSKEDLEELNKINETIKNFTNSKNDFEKQEQIRLLRTRKKELLAKAEELYSQRKKAVVYKNVVEVNDAPMVEKKFPPFKKVRWPYKNQMPYFTAGLTDFLYAVEKGEETAIFGGPCFFGEYEVDMIFSMKDGSQKVYDFTTRRRTVKDKISQEAEFTKTHTEDVLDVSFVSHKTLITTDEYDSILYLFELARATGSALTIPIPDFSYEKYLAAMVETLSPEIQKRAMERFAEVSKPIIRLYKNLFDFFKKQYPEVKCLLMSGEEKEELDAYYSERTPYVEKTSTKRIISGIQEKIESVKDYITLPALPYYLWGIKNILEVDYLGETDSFWKCRKMHRGDLNLSALLYPIKISEDGWRTLFSTELQYKEYIREEEYGRRW